MCFFHSGILSQKDEESFLVDFQRLIGYIWYMRALLIPFYVFPFISYGGTGHTKDMGLTYLLLITFFSLLLLFWNAIDHISKNRRLYITKLKRVKDNIYRSFTRIFEFHLDI